LRAICNPGFQSQETLATFLGVRFTHGCARRMNPH
jgi:hypothetical protein